MLASRRALLHHLNSSNRCNNYVSIPHKNQLQGTTTTTPLEDSLTHQLYNNTDTAEGSERSTPTMTSTEEERRKSPRKTVEPVEEMAKEAAVGAMETALKLGRIAKHTMDGMWEIAEKTTESVRDSVADGRGRSAGGNDFKYRR